MTVAELIKLLQKMPQDVIVIEGYMSDYLELSEDDFTVMDGAKDYAEKGRGLIRHKGHLMLLEKYWNDRTLSGFKNPEFVTAVYIRGN